MDMSKRAKALHNLVVSQESVIPKAGKRVRAAAHRSGNWVWVIA